jgi:glycerol-3-phosphate O-acyltransferase
MYLFFNHFKESQVVAGEPVDLKRFLADEGDAPDEVLARRLRWQLGGRIESEMRVVLGPQRKGAPRISEEVLKSRKLNAEAREIAREENLPPKVVEKRARQSLKEIAADPKPWLFDLFVPVLRLVWRRIFDGLDVDLPGLERCREAARKGPLILVPSHKSHIDYLVLSYVFSQNDLVPPHIAAGANLSFFPLGPLFRRGGAFFLRRSFKGDKLYGAVFRAYVRKLLREGNSIEFFIEGGRSRTGKLLAPKLGLLGMMVEAALDDDGQKARRAQVVPISIGYEKVIEEKSYARELAGGEKKKEDLGGLLRATRVLRSNYGRLNIQFDEPFPLGATLRDDGAMVAWDEDENVVVPSDEHARRLATQRLAHRIVFGINRATAVTPTALVASALLGTGRRGVTRKELLDNARFLMERARAAGGRLAQATVDARGGLNLDALDRALDLLSGDRDLEVRSGSGTLPGGGRALDEIYTIPDDRRPQLAFYRNNAIHLYVAEALVALALLGSTAPAAGAERVVARSLLRERTLTLSRLLKLEFTYRVGATFETIFDDTVASLIQARLLTTEVIGDATPALRAAQIDRLELLAGQVKDFVEAYRVAARAVSELTGPIGSKDLVKRIHELGERLYLTGNLSRREASIDANYQNAIAYFRERGILVEEKDKKLRRSPGDAAQRLHSEIAALLPSD